MQGKGPPEATEELGERILKVAELYDSRKSAALAAGISTDMLASYIKGENKPRFSALSALVKPVGVSLDWLSLGDGPMLIEERAAGSSGSPSTLAQQNGVPVIGLAECGLKGWFQRDSLKVTASRPGDFFDPEGFAVIAVGQSMIPAGIFEGFLCFCSPRTPPGSGDAAYVEKTDGTATIKVFRGLDREWLTLEGWLDEHNTRRDPFTDRLARGTIRRIAPIIYVKRKL